MLERDRNVGLVVPSLAPGTREVLRLATTIEHVVAREVDTRFIEVLVGDQVDDTRDSVRTVHRRGTVLQDLGALHDRARDDVEVGCSQLATRTGGREATAVQQHERTGGTDTTQRDGVGARTVLGHEACSLVVDLLRTRGERVRLQDLGGAQQAFERSIFTRDDEHGRGGRELGALDTRAGDNDFLNFSRIGGLILLLLT